MMIKRMTIGLLFLFLSITCLLWTSPKAISQPNSIVIGHGAEPSNLFPLCSDQACQDRITGVSEPLVFLDEDAKTIPALATKWEIADGKKWRFYLRKDVVFHNGEKFLAEDVAFTINTCLDPNVKCPRIGLIRGYRCEIVNDYTVDIINEKGPRFLLL
jgi:peptide/nickel transport system substrate-binding protein